MILVNRNFGNPVLREVIGDMFKSVTADNQNIEWVNHTNVLAAGSTLVSSRVPQYWSGTNLTTLGQCKIDFLSTQNIPLNFFVVTEHFLKVLDKVYTKIWNESFTETGIYNISNLITLYNGFVSDTSLGSDSKIKIGSNIINSNIMLFKKFVDRCITAGILLEEDRLDYKDQISLSNLNRPDLSTQVDLDNKTISFTASKPIDIAPDLNALAGEYLAGKKLYLMVTPYLPNESTIRGTSATDLISAPAAWTLSSEPFTNYFSAADTQYNRWFSVPVKRPISFFKPKTTTSKYGRSLPLASHLVFSLGNENDRDEALLLGEPTPDIIVDHKDRISHIDSFTLKIKFDKLQF